MNYAPFVWSTAIIFITTPTDNKVPRVAVCHLAGILWQMTSCLVYSQLSALVSCPQRITAAPRKSTNMLDVKLSFFFFFLPVLSDNAARMTVTCFTTSFLVFKPASSLGIFLPSFVTLPMRKDRVGCSEHRQMGSHFCVYSYQRVTKMTNEKEGNRSNEIFNLSTKGFNLN